MTSRIAHRASLVKEKHLDTAVPPSYPLPMETVCEGCARLGEIDGFAVYAVHNPDGMKSLERELGRGHGSHTGGAAGFAAVPPLSGSPALTEWLDAVSERGVHPDWPAMPEGGAAAPVRGSVSRFVLAKDGLSWLVDYGSGAPSVRFCVPWGVAQFETEWGLATLYAKGGAALADAMGDRFSRLEPDATLPSGTRALLADAILHHPEEAPDVDPMEWVNFGFACDRAAAWWLRLADVARVSVEDAVAFGTHCAVKRRGALADFAGRAAAAGRADVLAALTHHVGLWGILSFLGTAGARDLSPVLPAVLMAAGCPKDDPYDQFENSVFLLGAGYATHGGRDVAAGGAAAWCALPEDGAVHLLNTRGGMEAALCNLARVAGGVPDSPLSKAAAAGFAGRLCSLGASGTIGGLGRLPVSHREGLKGVVDALSDDSAARPECMAALGFVALALRAAGFDGANPDGYATLAGLKADFNAMLDMGTPE